MPQLQQPDLEEAAAQPQYEANEALSPISQRQQPLKRERPISSERLLSSTAERSRRVAPTTRPLPNPRENLGGPEPQNLPTPPQRSNQSAKSQGSSGQPSRYWSRQEAAQPRFYQNQKTSQPPEARQFQQLKPETGAESVSQRSSPGSSRADQRQAPHKTVGDYAKSLRQEAGETGERKGLLQQAAIIQSSPEMAFTDNDALWHPELGILLQQQGRSLRKASAAGNNATAEAAEIDKTVESSFAGLSAPARSTEAEMAHLRTAVEQGRSESSEGSEGEARKHEDLQSYAALPPELDSAHPSIEANERKEDLGQSDVNSDSPSEKQSISEEGVISDRGDSGVASKELLRFCLSFRSQ